MSFAAAYPQHYETLVVLLGRHADLKAADQSGATALHRAAGMRNSKAVTALLESGADPNFRTNRGDTALFSALEAVDANESPEKITARLEVVQSLIAAGADPSVVNDFPGSTPLHAFVNALRHDGVTMTTAQQIEICRLLIDAGANVSAENTDGRTPADLARKNSNVALAEWLEAQGK